MESGLSSPAMPERPPGPLDVVSQYTPPRACKPDSVPVAARGAAASIWSLRCRKGSCGLIPGIDTGPLPPTSGGVTPIWPCSRHRALVGCTQPQPTPSLRVACRGRSALRRGSAARLRRNVHGAMPPQYCSSRFRREPGPPPSPNEVPALRLSMNDGGYVPSVLALPSHPSASKGEGSPRGTEVSCLRRNDGAAARPAFQYWTHHASAKRRNLGSLEPTEVQATLASTGTTEL